MYKGPGMDLSLSKHNYDGLLEDLRKDTLTLLAIYAAVGSWITILFSALFVPITPIGAIPLWLVFEAICLTCLWLKRYDVRVSTFLFLSGYCLCNISASYVFATPTFIYLTAAIPLASSILVPRRTTLAITALASIGIPILLRPSPAFFASSVPAVIIWWLVFLISFTAFEGL